MALEGRIRDLGLTEVLQLLALGRKTGTLHCTAPVQGRRASLAFEQGALIDAVVHSVDARAEGTPRRRANDAQAVEQAAHEILLWRDGTFRFAPGERPAHDTVVRLAVEPLLMEATMRAAVWARIELRVPHARVTPTFVDIEPQQLPLLRLTPPQWEILTGVDGERDLMALATAMERDVTEVAELVHDLIAAGLLTLREGQAVPRRNPTPPATSSLAGPELWVPGAEIAGAFSPPGEYDEDTLFDPVELGVLTAEGLPRRRTPWKAPAPVAPDPVEPSLPREQHGVSPVTQVAFDGPTLCRQGDELARRGDLEGAMGHWNAALRATVPVSDPDRVREAVTLAARLHALLHP